MTLALSSEATRPGQWTMDPESKAFAVLRLLTEGPATTAEVRIDLSMPASLAHRYLQNLEEDGKVARQPFRAGQCRHLWSITPKGERCVRLALEAA